jgi:rubrerythrin
MEGAGILRRLLPRPQDARCSGCGRTLRERRRKPCPACGSLNRIIERGWCEGSTATDRMG